MMKQLQEQAQTRVNILLKQAPGIYSCTQNNMRLYQSY